jgi:predicted dienelactone hydrolase
VRTETFWDEARRRSIVTEIWYPAAGSGDPAEVYPITDFLPEKYRGEDLGVVPTTAVRDAEQDRSSDPPLILFSHGNAGLRIQSTYLTVALASRGYVVAAPDHAGNTLYDFAALEAPEGTLAFDLESVLESYADRPLDLSAIVDQIDSTGLQVDRDRIGVVGHSFGAVTALRSVALDPRIDAAVSQAPAAYELSWLDVDAELEEVGRPIMLQAGGMDRLNPDRPVVDSVWAHVGSPGRYVRFHRAGHFTFSDMCLVGTKAIVLAEKAGLGDLLEDGCGPGNVPPQAAHAMLEGLTGAFFDVELGVDLDSEPGPVDPAEVAIEVR